MDGTNSEMPVPPATPTKTKTLPDYVEHLRFTHPQAVIESLFERKEVYKAAGTKQYQRAVAAEAKLKESERRLAVFRKKLKEERAMKKFWRNVCLYVGITVVTMTIAMLWMNLLAFKQPQANQKMPVSGVVQRTGSHVLASVNIINGGTQGSGVVISKGEEHALVLSAAHNFSGKIGGDFWVYYPDGTYTKATLLAIDRERDLALCRVDPKTILSHSYIPKAIFTGDLTGVGYTGGEGPKRRKLIYDKAYYNTQNKYMWEFAVESGPFGQGDSGSGVFIDEACVGIAVERGVSGRLFACSHDEIMRFLKTHTATMKGFGDYHEQEPIPAGADAPPPWTPSPNVPIHTTNRLDKMVADLRADVDMLKKGAGKVPEEKKDFGLKRPSEVKD
jgi:hypothetical protein